MSLTPSNDDDSMTTADFSNVYNKWLKELLNVEKNLTSKASEVQLLQCTLNNEAEMLKNLNETLLPVQIEQNYLEELLDSLLKEQKELEQELLKLEEIEYSITDTESDGYIEECPTIVEIIEKELATLKETVKDTVKKINTKMLDFEQNKNPFSMYRTIMDRYTDALEALDISTAETQEKLNKLNNVCLQSCIRGANFV